MDDRITCVYSEGRESWEQHFHNTHELVYVQSGRVRFRISGKTYDASAGTLLFISKLEEHSAVILQEPYRRWWVRVTAEQLAAAADDLRLRAVWERRPADFCHAFDISPIAGEAEWLLSAMAAEREGLSYGRHRLLALLQLLLIGVYRTRRDQFPLPVRGVNLAAEQIQSYIDAHFAKGLTVGELARRFSLSISYLSHIFHGWTGVSPQQYILLCRLSLARELLLTTDAPVADIAARCGFGDVSNFIRTFRQHTGCTPATYRKHGGE